MNRPWANLSLTPAARAESLLAELTLEEKAGTYVVTAGAHAGDRPLRTVVSL
jgi:hypothetical protein